MKKFLLAFVVIVGAFSAAIAGEKMNDPWNDPMVVNTIADDAAPAAALERAKAVLELKARMDAAALEERRKEMVEMGSHVVAHLKIALSPYFSRADVPLEEVRTGDDFKVVWSMEVSDRLVYFVLVRRFADWFLSWEYPRKAIGKSSANSEPVERELVALMPQIYWMELNGGIRAWADRMIGWNTDSTPFSTSEGNFVVASTMATKGKDGVDELKTSSLGAFVIKRLLDAFYEWERAHGKG